MQKWCFLTMAVCLAAMTVTSCSDDDDDDNVVVVGAGFADVIGITATNRVVGFSAGAPGTMLQDVAITGLNAGEMIAAADFRPATGDFFALTSTSRVGTVNATTGVFTQVGAGPLAPALTGTDFGLDFNPVPDRVRVVSTSGQNVRLNPNTGALAATDGNLAFDAGDVNVGATPNVVACAYTNPFPGTQTTTLYGIDTILDILVRQGSLNSTPVSPNAGTLFSIGSLGVDITNVAAFDITENGGAFLVGVPNGTTAANLYSINLTTGAATLLGAVGGSPLVAMGVNLAAAPRVIALRSDNSLTSFAPGTPGTTTTPVAITGLQGGEDILGIDYRPATGELYGLGSTSRVYLINATTGVATAVGAMPFTSTLSGTAFGFDFNPVPDRIRCVSDTAQNLRLNPTTGATAATDGTLAYDAGDVNNGMAPRIVGSAYTNSFSGTTSTTLYGIDSTLNILVTQGSLNSAPVSPNTGTLFTVGALGVDVGDLVGFDITPAGGALVSATAPAGTDSQFYTINLTTGALSSFGTIGGGVTVRDIAFQPAALPRIYAATSANRLISFVPGRPDTLLSDIAIIGLQLGENVVGLDYRPATRQLFVAGSSSRLYTIDTTTGLLTDVAPMSFTPTLTGTDFGFDFNPVPDRIRLVSSSDQNLRLNPNTGTVAMTDGTLAFDAGDPNNGNDPNVVGVAYTNSFSGTTSTTLYGIDSNLDILLSIGSIGSTPISPNSGTLFTIAATGFDSSSLVGFDITPKNAAFASLTAPAATTSQLFSINLATGLASALGTIGAPTTIVDIAMVLPGL